MQRSPGRSGHHPVIAPPPRPTMDLEAVPLRIRQPRDAHGRFERSPGPRSVRDRKTGCERWIGPMRGNTPWDGRGVLTTRWEAIHGPLPPGHRLVRICPTPRRCVNPDHAVLLSPGQAQVYRYASKESVWLSQEEADEIHSLVAEFAKRCGISLGAAIAWARWPYGLAEALPDPA
jgi:hypothetical protein